jgi:hypothetical protein
MEGVLLVGTHVPSGMTSALKALKKEMFVQPDEGRESSLISVEAVQVWPL